MAAARSSAALTAHGYSHAVPDQEHGYAFFANCFRHRWEQRLWAVARKELEPFIVSGEGRAEHFAFTEKSLDAGNYSPGYGFLYSSILTSAREFGDREIAGIAQESLERDCSPIWTRDRKSYLEPQYRQRHHRHGALHGHGDFRRSVVANAPCQDSLRGPYLTGIEYPDILVARGPAAAVAISISSSTPVATPERKGPHRGPRCRCPLPGQRS